MDQEQGDESKNTTSLIWENGRIKGFFVCFGDDLKEKREKCSKMPKSLFSFFSILGARGLNSYLAHFSRLGMHLVHILLTRFSRYLNRFNFNFDP